MERAKRELSHEEEFMLFKEELGEIVGNEKEGCEPPFVNNVLRRARRCISKLREELKSYKSLEEQGLLLKLPCNVGDVVYSAEYEEVKAYTVTSIRVHETAIYAYNHHFYIGEVGMSVFPTKAEAEKALAEMEK